MIRWYLERWAERYAKRTFQRLFDAQAELSAAVDALPYRFEGVPTEPRYERAWDAYTDAAFDADQFLPDGFDSSRIHGIGLRIFLKGDQWQAVAHGDRDDECWHRAARLRERVG